MSIPDLTPPWTRIPLVHETTDLFDPETQNALDARYTSGGGGGVLPVASTTVAGIVELATDAETVTGTDPDRAVTPAGLTAALAGVTVPDASTTTKGIVELATNAETVTGTDTVRATTPAGVAAAMAAFTDHVSPTQPVTGQYIRPFGSPAGGNAAPSLNNMALTPFVIAEAVTVDAFLMFANTSNGTTHDVGLYPSNANGTPDFTSGPLRSASFTFATATPTVTFTALSLTRGLYYFAFRSGGTGPSVAKMPTTFVPALPFVPSTWSHQNIGYNDSGVTSLPSGAFTPTVTTSASNLFFTMLRISSVP